MNLKKIVSNVRIVARAINHHTLTKNNRLAAWRRFIKWQAISRIYPDGIVVPYVGETKLIIKRGMHGATGAIYTGLQEFEDMAFLMHFLKTGDTFIDIGANIGSYSILAAGVSKAKVICVEPIPQTFRSLVLNIQVNDLSGKIVPVNKGLGSSAGVLKFTNDYDTVNHVVIDENRTDFIEVPVDTLDELLASMGSNSPAAIKMDVEGFEMSVLIGAVETLKDPALKVIIAEINGCCNAFGIKEIEIHDKIIAAGFTAFSYDPFTRELQRQESYTANCNTLYIRDEEYVKKRLLGAQNVSVFNKTI